MAMYDSGISMMLQTLGAQMAQQRRGDALADVAGGQAPQQGYLAKLLGFGAPDQQPGSPMQLQGATPSPQQPMQPQPAQPPASGGILGALGSMFGGQQQPQQPPANALPYAPQDPNVPNDMVRVGSTVMSPKAAGMQPGGSPNTGSAGPYGSQPTASATPSLYPQGQGPLPTFAAGQGQPTGLLSTPGIAGLFTAQEQRYGLPAGYLSRTAQIESNGDPNAYNKGSKAAGLFQFIPSTAAQYGLSDPTNIGASTSAAAQLAASNASTLRNALGRDPTPGELYLAHQQGAGGASKLLANPNARAGDIVGDAAVRANGGDPNMTAGQFANLWTNKFAQGGASAGGSPYGGLNQNAFNGPQAGQQGPILAQPGMGGLIPSGGGFAPPQQSTTSQSVGNAYSASGQAVPTDAQGNALDASGQPTALAYGGQTAGAAAAPASRAITGALGGGQPYGSVPLNVNGRMMTRDQADANKGTDYSDYDDAAAKAGLIPSAAAAPAYGAQGVVPAARAPQQPATTSIPATPAVLAGAQSTGTLSLSSPNTQTMLQTLLRDPDTMDVGVKLWQSLMAKPEYQFHALDDGRVMAFDPSHGTGTIIAQGIPSTDAIKNYTFAKGQGYAGSFTDYQSDQQKADKAQLVEVPQPNGTMLKTWLTPGQAPGGGTTVGSPYTKTPSTAVTIDQKAETSSEAAFGKAQGDEFGSILKAGAAARGTQGQLALMNDAFQQSNGQIATGPFAKSILGAKQAILGATGIDLGGVPESEAVQKLGFGLATNLTKEISQRPAQQEFLKALENVPGIFMSPQGSRVMMSVLNQQAQQKIDLAGLVSDRANRQNWPAVEQNYYDTHPLLSPFTGKPLSVNDVSALAGAAQQAGIDPTTGRAAGAPGAPTAAAGGPRVQVNSVDDYNRLPSGTPYLDPNGNPKVKR